MSLYRARYMRGSRLHGMTFAARNAALARLYAYTVLQSYVDSIGGSVVWVEGL